MEKDHRTTTHLLTAAALIWLALIWLQSALPASISSLESMMILKFLQTGRIGAESGTSFPLFVLFSGITENFIRKAAHFIEYFVFGLLADSALRKWGRNFGEQLSCGLAAALIDETIQYFTSGRSSQVTDVWLDFFGYCTGFLLICSIHLLRKSKE